MISFSTKRWTLLAGAAGLLAAGAAWASTDQPASAPLAPAPRSSPAAPPPEAPPADGRVKVVLRCVVMTDATVDHCHVASETPPGHGLGEAALKMVSQIRIDRDTFTRDMVGQAVDIPLSFAPDQPNGDMPDGVAAMPM